MVDALRRAHRIAAPSGVVVDLHPSSSPAVVEVGAFVIGDVDSPQGPRRHAAADAAIAAAVDAGWFAVTRVVEFSFYTHADTIEELRDFVAEHWHDARIDDATVIRTRERMRGAGARPRTRERVILTILRPLGQPAL